MGSPDPKICVVVVTYNSRELMPDMLDSIEPAFGSVPYQLVVVDNDSSDGTPEAVESLAPRCMVIRMGRNAGYAAGINAGVAAVRDFSAVLVLNADVRLGPGSIAELVRALSTPATGIAVPRLTDGSGNLLTTMRREPTAVRALADALLGARRAGRYRRLGELVADPALYREDTVTDWAEGSTQLISAACWWECGPWDESFFLYSEETEYDLRARDAGFRTRYVATAHGVHLGGESRTSPFLWGLLTANRIVLFHRRNGLARTIPFWAALVLREASRALLGQRTSRAGLRTLLDHRKLHGYYWRRQVR